MKQGEMGIGTLILFIAFILIALVGVVVLTRTSSILQSKALATGKGAAQEVSSSFRNVEIYALDGTNGNLDYFYNTIKLASGSEPMKFTNNYILFTVSLNNVSSEYSYNGNNITGISAIDCSVDPSTDATGASLGNTSNDGKYGIEYVLKGPSYTAGYLSDGDMVKICFKSPRIVRPTEEMRFTYLPKSGSPTRLKLYMPSIVSNKRIYIFP
jgi:archaellin